MKKKKKKMNISHLLKEFRVLTATEGEWSWEEDQELEELVETLGEDWERISRQMRRAASRQSTS